MAYQKILAIKLRSLGDTVLATAALEQLKKAFPNSEIQLAVSAAWAPLFERFPGINRIWPYERRKEMAARAKAIARLAFQLRREKFDCVVCLHASPSSATLAFATGAKTRSIHFHGHRERNRYSTVEVPGKGILKPIIERDMDTIRALGVEISAGKLPQIFLSDLEKNKARLSLQESNLNQPLLGIGLGASRATKQWPAESFARLAIDWCKKQRGSVLAISGPDETEQTSRFLQKVDQLLSSSQVSVEERAQIRKKIQARSQFDIRELAAIISQLSVFATNDSGPKHVAVAVGTPTVSFFGPENPFEWHPYPTESHPYFFIENLSCRQDALPGMPPWCGLNVCVQEGHKCMKSIEVEQALSECQRIARNV